MLSLPPGTRLGQYEIVDALGAGGMGEVYRARDSKLDRTVAIKVLLPAVARDADRLARFEREAKTLASLNHPNIAHVYGLEDGPGGLFLAMVDLPRLVNVQLTNSEHNEFSLHCRTWSMSFKSASKEVRRPAAYALAQ